MGGPGGACWRLRWQSDEARLLRPSRCAGDGHRSPGDSDDRRSPGDSDDRRLPPRDDRRLPAPDSDGHRLPGDSDGRRLPAPTLHRFRSARGSGIRVAWGPWTARVGNPAGSMHARHAPCMLLTGTMPPHAPEDSELRARPQTQNAAARRPRQPQPKRPCGSRPRCRCCGRRHDRRPGARHARDARRCEMAAIFPNVLKCRSMHAYYKYIVCMHTFSMRAQVCTQ